jgi:hypothetical protein
MGGPVPLYPTPTRLALLGDVRGLLVTDDWLGVPTLDYGDGKPVRVADAVRQMARAGWVYQEPGHRLWRLTQRGLDVLEGRR